MGYSDLGCYGGEIRTPALDGLAAGGLRFTQFYNTARCCPTRASILTGLYPHQTGVGWMMTDGGFDGYRGDLNRRCVTIAEALRPAGYATYAVGKWHVTKETNPEGPKHNWPLQRGFDRFYGTITGAGSFFDPGTLTRDNTMISPFADPEYRPETFYYTDAISDHAVRFIDEHFEKQAPIPFFMYVAYTCAHWPMHALEEDVAAYRGRYDAGYGPVRERRFERLREMGLIEPGWELSPQEGDWEKFPHKEWETRCMEVYAAMITNMDAGIGRIVESLRRHGQLDNTLVFYLQDNGGCQEGVGRTGEGRRPAEPSLEPIAADAIRLDVIPKQNRSGVPTLMGPNVMPGPEDTYIAYGINWANVSNTPFREYKHFVHEGGISTPLIAHWPARIKRDGELEHQPGHLIDLMATCLDVAGADYPETFGGEAIQPMEGTSLAAAFDGKPLARRNPIFWEHEGNRAVRDGQWKLVAKENQPWELYDLEADRTEMHDLAAPKAELVQALEAKWNAYAERAMVLPLGAWRAKPKPEKLSRKKRFELSADEWTALFDGNSLAGWKVAGHGGSIRVEDGAIVCGGPPAHAYYAGDVENGDFRNFELKAAVKTWPGANSGIYFHTEYEESGFPAKGYEVQINNTYAGPGKYREYRKTGSLYGVRNVFKSIARDGQWFTMRIRVVGKRVRILVGDTLVVDYTEPDEPVLTEPRSRRRLGHGTFALQCHDPGSKVAFKDIGVKPLADDLAEPAEALPVVDERYAEIQRLQRAGFPLIDLHVHLKGGLTLEEALANSRRVGIAYGIAPNCGVGFPITDDAGIDRFVESMKGQPCFLGMQAEGREWVDLFSREAIERFDYVFTDAMTFTDHRGKRVRLWIEDEVEVGDKQAFMEMLVERTVAILSNEPIDVYVNPTFLPAVIAGEYDQLWTGERMDRVIEAAAKNGVAIEINAKLRLPRPEFIQRAKRAGVKFTFGTNNGGRELGRLEYCLDVIQECGLTPGDMFVPGGRDG